MLHLASYTFAPKSKWIKVCWQGLPVWAGPHRCGMHTAVHWTRLSPVHRYRSILQLVKPWYDEVKDYSFPYPRDCNPRCPLRCYGPMCTHYTQVRLKQPILRATQLKWSHNGVNRQLICPLFFLQMVWATSNKVGCAVHTCHNMNVWGSVWKRATYLVCNYSPK